MKDFLVLLFIALVVGAVYFKAQVIAYGKALLAKFKGTPPAPPAPPAA